MVLALVWLAFMAWQHTRVVTDRSDWIEDCEVDDSCAGRRVFLALVEVRAVEGDRYLVRKLQDDHLVYGDPSDLTVGETVSVIAQWQGEQLVEQELTHHPWRKYKSVLGLVGVGLTGLLLVGGFRIRDGRIVPRG